ncbi:MAG: peptide chain release factor subunit 1 [Candidatus Atribacteria bacterium]|nr:peptide chain release factor subunit 1 [Candidatus Atribacteria bacterium]
MNNREERLITAEKIEEIIKYRPQKGWVTSFYLNIDPRFIVAEKFKKVAQNIYREKLAELKSGDIAEERVRQFERDFSQINQFLEEKLEIKGRTRGVAAFVNSEENLFRVFLLPQAAKNQIIFDPDPYLRPLTAILDEYHRLLVAIVDHRDARLFEVYMGEIMEHEEHKTNIRGKIKEGGWYGLEERRIERKIENQILQHYKEVAFACMEHFRKGHFDYLLVGIKKEDYPTFLNLLHSYLRTRVKGRLNLNPKDPINVIIEEALKAEQNIETEEDNQILQELMEKIGNDDLATSSLPNVLRTLHFGACQMVVVDEDFIQEGFVCPQCHYITLEKSDCPLCNLPSVEVEDIIDEIIEEVLLQGGEVKYIKTDNPLLEKIQRIGAFLRFKV